MTWREIEANSLQKLRNRLIIDVRSPCEFEVERIPSAINIPLLTDSEREEVGIVYATEGQIAARRVGLKIISPKIPQIIDQIVGMRKQYTSLVVHCWRGGLRSEAVASLLTMAGIDCWRLTGGYKAWRRFVLDEFARDAFPFETVVLHGRTGTGKTEILNALKDLGVQVLDLEGLSEHRGSLFGALGLSSQPTQKNFEGRLWEELSMLEAGVVFIEAESRKIGKLSLPDCIMTRIEKGRKILVTGTMPARVKRLMECYTPDNDQSLVHEALKILPSLTDRVGKQVVADLTELAAKGSFAELVERLLDAYYDPIYDKHIAKCQPYDFEVNSDDSRAAGENILRWSALKSETATTQVGL